MKMSGKKLFKIISAFIITFVLIYFLLKQISIYDISTMFYKLSFFWFLVAFVFYMIGYLFRTWRFKFLLKEKIKLKSLFSVVCAHNMFNQLLPFRTGELSFVYLMKKQGIKGSKAVSTLFIARAFDFLSIVIIFFVSVFFIESQPIIYDVLFTTGIILLVLILLLISVIFFGEKIVKFFIYLAKVIKLRKSKTYHLFVNKLNEVIDDFQTIRSAKQIFITGLFSILIWISIYMMYQALFFGIGLKLAFWTIIAGVSLTFFTIMLPIHGIAGFGTIEAAWSIFFFILGVSKEIAISSSFIFHIVLVLYFLILGIYGLTMLKIDSLHKPQT
jgi:uncharacterized protein (TIRG00374 family)